MFKLFCFVVNKFTKDCLTELDAISERIVAIVCDGSEGRAASLLGLSDEYSQHSCRAYGAVATIERPSTTDLPLLPDSMSCDTPSDPHPTGGRSSLFASSSGVFDQSGGGPLSSDVQFIPEIRVHHLTIDLTSHCKECVNDPFPISFHLKMFGGSAQRRLALAVPKCESRLVKSLKVMLDQSVGVLYFDKQINFVIIHFVINR